MSCDAKFRSRENNIELTPLSPSWRHPARFDRSRGGAADAGQCAGVRTMLLRGRGPAGLPVKRTLEIVAKNEILRRFWPLFSKNRAIFLHFDTEKS
jgi:hypothetical protein